jgi:hypothetical protein
LVEIKSVADDELIFDFEANPIGVTLASDAEIFPEEDARFDFGGTVLPEVIGHAVHGKAGVVDIIEDKDALALMTSVKFGQA